MINRWFFGLLALIGTLIGTAATRPVLAQNDLSITKTAPPSTSVGQNLTYTIKASNNGPSSASNVALSDPLPPGTTFVSATQTSGPAANFFPPAAGQNGTFTAILSSLSLDGISNPNNLTAVGNTLFFTATDQTNGQELWKSDGTPAGTVLVKDIYPGVAGSNPLALADVGGTLFFLAQNPTSGTELWKSNGTEAGTLLVKDIFPGDTSSNASGFTMAGNTVYFTADDGSHGTELWKSDGTPAGTVLVKDINLSGDSNPSALASLGGTLYFRADDGTSGNEFWKSDGTPAGTVLVKDINPGSDSSAPNDLTNAGGTLYFRADDGTHGTELWKSDGTTAGTTLVRDINPGSGSSDPTYLTVAGSTLFFQASEETHGPELWKSDGTEAGTILVKDINPGSDNSFPYSLVAVGNTLYFRAMEGNYGAELWKSDGTEAGTVLVKDIFPGSGSSAPYSLTAAGSTLFFVAQDTTSDYELWKSDGTTAGTLLVKDINPGSDSSSPGGLTALGNTLFFTASDGQGSLDLWKSDGTTTGTTPMRRPGVASFEIVVNVGSGASGTISNTASVTSSATDPNPANNSATATTIIDTAKPVPTISTPAQNQLLTFSAFGSITGSATDNASVSEVLVKLFRNRNGVLEYWNGESFGSTQTLLPTTLATPGSSRTTWSYEVTPQLRAALDDGAYTVYAYARDAQANQSNAVSRSFKLSSDETKPVPSITSPTAGQSLPTNNFTAIAGSASDNVGVTEVLLKLFRTRSGVLQYWNGSSFGSTATFLPAALASPGATSTTWSYAVSAQLSSALDTGSYGIQAYARDATGNQSSALSRNFVLTPETVKPVPVISSPTQAQTLSINNFGSITGSATDNVGVTQVLLKLFRTRNGVVQYWNGEGFGSAQVLLPVTLASPGSPSTNWNYTVSSQLKTALDEGAYGIQAYARDAAENQSNAVSRNFTLTTDDTKPVPVISTPTQGQTLTITNFKNITGSASDNSGVNQVLLRLYRSRGGVTQYWNGTAFTPTATTFPATLGAPDSPSTNWVYTIRPQLQAALDSGAYGIQAYARDTSGNGSAAVSRTFTLTVPSPSPATPSASNNDS